MSGPKYSAKAPTVDEMFGSLVGKALRRQNDDRLDVAIDICLDVEKLGGHALDCANALSAFKFHLAKPRSGCSINTLGTCSIRYTSIRNFDDKS